MSTHTYPKAKAPKHAMSIHAKQRPNKIPENLIYYAREIDRANAPHSTFRSDPIRRRGDTAEGTAQDSAYLTYKPNMLGSAEIMSCVKL